MASIAAKGSETDIGVVVSKLAAADMVAAAPLDSWRAIASACAVWFHSGVLLAGTASDQPKARRSSKPDLDITGVHPDWT